MRGNSSGRRRRRPRVLTANHEHRALRRFRDGRAHRAEQHAGESPAATASEDYQRRVLRLVDEPVCRPVAHDPPLNVDLRILLLPTGQAFGEQLVALVLVLVPIHAQYGEIPTSLQACSATKSTCRRDSSSNANAVAASDVGEPSMPTSTGEA